MKEPIKNRYIVTLNESAGPQVEPLARALAQQFGGRVLGTMSHAMRGFGIYMTDAQAHALSNHPLVALVEEDQPVHSADEQPFTFGPREMPERQSQPIHLFPNNKLVYLSPSE